MPTLPFGPRLGGERLDGVVAVEGLQALEEVERATRAARAPHVDADDHVALQREHGRLLRGAARAGTGRSPSSRRAPATARVRRLVGERDVGAQRRAVARRDVAEALVEHA